jgi:predicted O-methyltransferase YrrM
VNRPEWATCLDQEDLWNGWALNHDSATAMANMLEKQKPWHTFESGSGASTILFAQYAEAHGGVHTAFESSAEYQKRTLDLLDSYATGRRTRVVHAPLIGTVDGPWYDGAPPEEIDFALIDGPRQQDGGRNAALHYLHRRLAKNCTVLLDDTDRPDEQAVLEAWRERFGAVFVPLPETTRSTSYWKRTEQA